MSGNRAQIIKAILLIISLLSIMLTATFAWFQYITDMNVDSITANTIKVNDTKVSLDGENWGTEVDFTKLEGFAFKPVCGDGVNFFTQDVEKEQITDQQGNIIYVNKPVGTFTQVSNAQSIVATTDFYINANYDVQLFWDSRSYINPTATDVEQLLEEGTVHKDLIAGAMRVALLKTDADGNFSLISIWVPNSRYQATIGEDTRLVQDFSLTGTPESEYAFYSASDNIQTVQTQGLADGYHLGGSTLHPIHYFWGELANIPQTVQTPIATLSAGVSHFRLVVWLDGTDREAVDYFAGGKIRSNIVLTTELVGETN